MTYINAKENIKKSNEITNSILSNFAITKIEFSLIKDEFRYGFHRELIFKNKNYHIKIEFSLHPLDYPNIFNVAYQQENKVEFYLHNIIDFQPEELYIYSEESIKKLISYILLAHNYLES